MVMVDYDSYFKYGPAAGRNGALEHPNFDPPCTCEDCRINNTALIECYLSRLDEPNTSKEKNWKDEQYLLCPPRVLGYILDEKRWAQLQVSCLGVLKAKTKEEADQFFSERLKLADDLITKKLKKGKRGKCVISCVSYLPVHSRSSVTATIQTHNTE